MQSGGGAAEGQFPLARSLARPCDVQHEGLRRVYDTIVGDLLVDCHGQEVWDGADRHTWTCVGQRRRPWSPPTPPGLVHRRLLI